MLDVRFSIRTGESLGLFFRNDGGEGIPGGRRFMTAAMAVCTSTVALSMSRLKWNWRVMFAFPALLLDTIESRPAMVVNCRSSGVVTADAIVLGSPPGSPALTFSVG